MMSIKAQQELIDHVKAQLKGRNHHMGVREIQELFAKPGPTRPGFSIVQDVVKINTTNLADIFTKTWLESWDVRPIGVCDVPVEIVTLDGVKPDKTILYLHGGGFYFGSPTGSRPCTTRLAKLTKARLVAVQYRLAPQYPFPAALLDVLVAYISFGFPILAGDSSGAALCLSVIQAVKDLPEIIWNGKTLKVPIPSAAVLSPMLDMTYSLPSWKGNEKTDIIEPQVPAMTGPVDDIWPTNPPRGDIYCEANTLIHPLVSPVLGDWEDTKVWITIGEERCSDPAKVIAQLGNGSLIEYVGLPHIFPMILHKLPQTSQFFQDWAEACMGKIDRKWKRVHMPGDRIEELNHLTDLTQVKARELISEAIGKRQPWTGPESWINSKL